MSVHALSCGCRSCGCLCPEHSPIRSALPCAAHAAPVAVARWIAGEVAALLSLLLLIACVAVWGSVFGAGFSP